MKTESTKKYFIPVIAILAIVFNIVLFLLKDANYTKTFWFTYAFIMFAFVAMVLVSLMAKEGKTGVAYIHPTVSVASLYLIVVLVFGIIMLFFPKAPVNLVLIPMILLTAIFIILYIFASMNRAIIQREDAPKPMMFKMTDVPGVVDTIIMKTFDSTLRNQLEEIKDLAINASKLIDDQLQAIDERIFNYIQFIEKNVRRNEMGNVYNNVKKVKELFKEREDWAK